MAQLGSAGALGALGRRFESCRPDSHSSRSQIYQNRVSKVSVEFPWKIGNLNLITPWFFLPNRRITIYFDGA